MVRNNPFTLEGKTILITGASSGIGQSVAIECSKMGASVIINGRNEFRLNETFKQLAEGNHVQIRADLLEKQEIGNMISQISCVDGIVHCAGFAKMLPFQFVKEKDLNDIMQVNFISPMMISQTLVKEKKINRNGSIIFISSISGVYCSSVAGSIYSASKGAINGAVKGMAIDLAPKGIRVNTICPGMIDTNIFSSGTFTAEQLIEDQLKYPLKRHGKPEEVAYAVIYLLSDASKWITGSNLLIDGGFTLL